VYIFLKVSFFIRDLGYRLLLLLILAATGIVEKYKQKVTMWEDLYKTL
jgi:hypothetical protein